MRRVEDAVDREPGKHPLDDDIIGERLAAAQAVCRKVVPMGGLSVPTKAQNARILAQMVKLSHCMRAHGEPKFPDPTSNGIRISPSSGIDPNSPQYQAAQKACAKDFPGGP